MAAAADVADRDPLQHAEKPQRREIETREAVEESPNTYRINGAPQDRTGTACERGTPAATRFASESVMATPTIHRNEGNTMSVMVQPCHSACCNGA